MAVTAIADADSRSSFRTKRRIIGVAMAAILLAWIGWWGYKHVVWWTPAGHEIARAVNGAITVNTSLLTPIQAYRNVPITAAQMAAQRRWAQRELTRYYTGPDLRMWQGIAVKTLDPRSLRGGKTDYWLTNWRADWIHLGELTILPGSTTATATASAEFRSNGGVINREDYTFHLVDTSAGWRVERDESSFQPGYGP